MSQDDKAPIRRPGEWFTANMGQYFMQVAVLSSPAFLTVDGSKIQLNTTTIQVLDAFSLGLMFKAYDDYIDAQLKL